MGLGRRRLDRRLPSGPWPVRTGPGGSVLRIAGVAGDAADLAAGDPRPVTGRIGGHRFELFVWPPGPPPSDPEAIRADGGCWVRLRFV
jgi:hypothetical protein